MNKTTYLYLGLFILFSAFTFQQDEKITGNQLAHYPCSDAIELKSGLFNYKPNEVYFAFDQNKTPFCI